VLQSGEVQPVGANVPAHVNVRVIVATNRNLMMEVSEGGFREDLFYRVAVGVLHLPPLRERTGDIGLLVDTLMKVINEDAVVQSGYKQKNISVKGRNILLSHAWQGNIRELYSTLLRASLWAKSPEISENDIQAALFKMPEKETGILGRELNKNFNIQDVMAEVARSYISQTLTESQGNKTQAAEKLGLASYQILKGWIEKYGPDNGL
jgi:transcriptional regulator with GAF, ATPase, and Fis domain